MGRLLKGDIVSFRRHLGDVEWVFLLPLLAGILTAVLSLSRVIGHQLEVNPTIMAAVFFGLVLGSVVIAIRMVKQPGPVHLWVGLVIGVAVFVLLGLGREATVANPSLLVFFGSGALAICAMILPGISGSLILVLIGMYATVLEAVNDREFLRVGVFTIGTIVGLALFSQVLHWALRHHHDVVLAGLIGLMAGSLRVVWPWPDGVDSSALRGPEGDLTQVLIAALVGFVAVFIVTRLASAREEKVSRQPQID